MKIKTLGYLVAGVLGVAGITVAGMAAEPAGAACAYRWNLQNGTEGGEEVNLCVGTSEDGTFSSSISDDYVITVKLNNYQGGAFSYYNDGTGLPFERIIVELEGENVIDAGDGVAFATNVPLEFTGEGSLKIRAAVPILGSGQYYIDGVPASVAEILQQYHTEGEEYIGEMMIKPAEKQVVPGETDDNIQAPAPDKSDTSEDHSDMIWHIIAGVYIGLSLIAFVVLAVRHFMKKGSGGKGSGMSGTSGASGVPGTPSVAGGAVNGATGANSGNYSGGQGNLGA